MLIRIELTEDSISTRSFSLRDIVRGLRRTSFDPLCALVRHRVDRLWVYVPCLYFGLVVSFDDLVRVSEIGVHDDKGRDRPAMKSFRV